MAAPSNLFTFSNSPSAISLTWEDNSSDETGFRIERRKINTDWTVLDTTSPNITGYSDNYYIREDINYYIREDINYYYRVLAAGTLFGYSNTSITAPLSSDELDSFVNTNEGKIKLLQDYFKTNTLYLGLWTSNNSTNPDNDLNTLLTLSTNYEVTFTDYARIKINASSWVINNDEKSAYTNIPIIFNPITNWTNIKGYFIASTINNTGKLIIIDNFEREGFNIDVNSGQFLSIYPIIKL